MVQHLIIKARRASIEEYIKANGGVLLKEGRQYRVKGHSGLVISGSRWYSHTLLKGGNTLDYLMEMEGIGFKRAVEILTQGNIDIVTPVGQDSIRDVSIPKRNENDKRVMAYLIKTRGISPEIILPLLRQGRIYESANTHNCVFTGVDTDGNIRYVMQRSTFPGSTLKFESEGSNKKYSFSLAGKSDTIYVFESPIDLLSYISIHNEIMTSKSHLLSLGGVTDISLESYISRTPGICKIIYCLDNDNAGKDAYAEFSKKYIQKGIRAFCHFPDQKDWNHQLLSETIDHNPISISKANHIKPQSIYSFPTPLY